MWELIRANRRRSVVLLFFMLLLLLGLGFAIGMAVFPGATNVEGIVDGTAPVHAMDISGGFVGIGIAFILWLIQAGAAYFQGDRLLLGMAGAKEIQKQDHPQLFNVVEEMTIAASLPQPPKVYIINDFGLNAFAAGRKPENAVVAVTAGLLGELNRDQLQGVVAHEIAHIKNRDIMFMQMTIVMLGTIVMVSELFLRGLWHSGSSRRYSGGDRKDGGAQAIFLVIALVLAILAPILAQIIYFAASRRREYLADAGAAVYTRYPEGLAQALEKISGNPDCGANHSKATAPMYIINPLSAAGKRGFALFSTHPPTEARIKILRSIAGGVSYAKYQQAYGAVHGRGGLIPRSGMGVAEQPLREGVAAPAATQPTAQERVRQVGDMLRSVENFIFLPCVCGLRVKVPPGFKQPQINCPRCNQLLEVPVAAQALGMAVAAAPVAVPPAPPKRGQKVKPLPVNAAPPLLVQRRGTEWESIRCECGAIKNIPPSLQEGITACSRCGRQLQVAPCD